MNQLQAQQATNRPVSAEVPRRSNRLPGYDQPYVTSRSVTYQVFDDAMNPTEASGTLPEGKVVWGAQDLLSGQPQAESMVLLEGKGLVRLQTGALKLSPESAF